MATLEKPSLASLASWYLVKNKANFCHNVSNPPPSAVCYMYKWQHNDKCVEYLVMYKHTINFNQDIIPLNSMSRIVQFCQAQQDDQVSIEQCVPVLLALGVQQDAQIVCETASLALLSMVIVLLADVLLHARLELLACKHFHKKQWTDILIPYLEKNAAIVPNPLASLLERADDETEIQEKRAKQRKANNGDKIPSGTE